ncbi:hypothetical protein WN55_10821 [Dufourea novaeangliae]|uniref:Uncharacterized protein n=1 Tax=Dufourea novaeangliae TaxID=178035 RepID=A0A154P9J2_DUFNO|nr:hypothetical protein WN55_10821 [Dufourea novaeangliae]
MTGRTFTESVTLKDKMLKAVTEGKSLLLAFKKRVIFHKNNGKSRKFRERILTRNDCIGVGKIYAKSIKSMSFV